MVMVVAFGLGWTDRHAAPNYRQHAIAAAMLGAACWGLTLVR
jgi:hypothetical protein